MPNKLRISPINSFKMIAFFVLIGLVSLFVLRYALLASPELKIEEDFTLQTAPRFEEDISVYVRKFRCRKVKEVEVRAFYIKSGEVTTFWDGYHAPTSGSSPSTSCLFLLSFGSEVKTPWVDFTFSEGGTASGDSRRIPIENGQENSQIASNLRYWPLYETPEQTSFSRNQPVLLYLELFGNAAASNNLKLLGPPSIQAAKDFSKQHKDVEILAVDLAWTK